MLLQRKDLQTFTDIPFRPHILQAVCFKLSPAFRIVFRQVSCPSSVCFGSFAWNGKVPDQGFTCRILLLTGFQHLCRCFQRQRQGQGCRPDHGAFPRVRREGASGHFPKDRPFKLCVPGCFRDLLVVYCRPYTVRDSLAAGQINDERFFIIKRHRQQQRFKGVIVDVAVTAAVRNIHLGIGFKVRLHIGRLSPARPVRGRSFPYVVRQVFPDALCLSAVILHAHPSHLRKSPARHLTVRRGILIPIGYFR